MLLACKEEHPPIDPCLDGCAPPGLNTDYYYGLQFRLWDNVGNPIVNQPSSFADSVHFQLFVDDLLASTDENWLSPLGDTVIVSSNYSNINYFVATCGEDCSFAYKIVTPWGESELIHYDINTHSYDPDQCCYHYYIDYITIAPNNDTVFNRSIEEPHKIIDVTLN